jgi:tetratricopeptide (TPR) repeat protein
MWISFTFCFLLFVINFGLQGIKFDRSGITAGEAIATLGDQHLAKLDDACKTIMASILNDKSRLARGMSASTDSVSNGKGHTEVALLYTEVLQLQGRPQEAVVVLSKAIEELNSDLSEAKRLRGSKKDASASDASSVVSSKTTGQTLEFDYLKKMKALCHRRIGSLYKLTNRPKDAEEHIKRYISIVERGSSNDVVRREISLAYSLLTSIYDAMGKSMEAQAADKIAIELAASMGRAE